MTRSTMPSSLISVSTTTNLGNGISLTTTGSSTVSIISPQSSNVPVPSLMGAIIISPSLSPEVVAAIRLQEDTLISQLKQSPTRVDLWLQLGVVRKIAGDYRGAIEAWNYVAAVAPSSYIAFADLGDLYQNFLKNYPLAETNYLEAVKLAPTDIDLYRNLFTFYHYQYKTNTNDALNIINQGLAANPGNAELLQLKSQLQ